MGFDLVRDQHFCNEIESITPIDNVTENDEWKKSVNNVRPNDRADELVRECSSFEINRCFLILINKWTFYQLDLVFLTWVSEIE